MISLDDRKLAGAFEALAPFVARLSSRRLGFASVALPTTSGLKYAVRLAEAGA